MFYDKYDELLSALPKQYPDLWKELFLSFSDNTLLRQNWILKSDNHVLITQERNGSWGQNNSWLYIIDEWCFLSSCMNIYSIQSYYGIPPFPENVFQNTVENIAFALDNTSIHDRLKDFQLPEHYSREERNGIDMVNVYTVIDIGENQYMRMNIDTRHNPIHKWVPIDQLEQLDLPFYDIDTVKQILSL